MDCLAVELFRSVFKSAYGFWQADALQMWDKMTSCPTRQPIHAIAIRSSGKAELYHTSGGTAARAAPNFFAPMIVFAHDLRLSKQ